MTRIFYTYDSANLFQRLDSNERAADFEANLILAARKSCGKNCDWTMAIDRLSGTHAGPEIEITGTPDTDTAEKVGKRVRNWASSALKAACPEIYAR